MRREILVFLLLILIIAASFINVAYVKRMSSEIIEEVNQLEQAGKSENFQLASEHFDAALMIWDKHRLYTGIFLRHPEIDSAYDCFFDVKEALLEENSESLHAICSKLKYHIEALANMEKLHLGSIL